MATLISGINFCLYLIIACWFIGYLICLGQIVYKFYHRNFTLDKLTSDVMLTHKEPTGFDVTVMAVSVILVVAAAIYQWTPFDPLAYGLGAVTFVHFFVTPILAKWYFKYMSVSFKA